ncbi:MAG: hypothetical protein JXR94_13685 [Candidatus Hydrogenedentes bacterium]|nr:hypothetical protein [Candidatus Hydrogenedentota bacterium]
MTFLCDILDSVYGFLGNAGVFDIPLLGNLLVELLDFLFELFSCTV